MASNAIEQEKCGRVSLPHGILIAGFAIFDLQSPKTNTLAKPKMDFTPYQIAPAALEPGRITYRVFIELQHEPEDFKTMDNKLHL